MSKQLKSCLMPVTGNTLRLEAKPQASASALTNIDTAYPKGKSQIISCLAVLYKYAFLTKNHSLRTIALSLRKQSRSQLPQGKEAQHWTAVLSAVSRPNEVCI